MIFPNFLYLQCAVTFATRTYENLQCAVTGHWNRVLRTGRLDERTLDIVRRWGLLILLKYLA